MSLKAKITEHMKDAMRAKDAPRLSTIRMLLAAVKQREVDTRRRQRLRDPPGQVTGPRGRRYQQPAVRDGAAHVRVDPRVLQHIVCASGHDGGLRRGEPFGRHEVERLQAHRLHGASR